MDIGERYDGNNTDFAKVLKAKEASRKEIYKKLTCAQHYGTKDTNGTDARVKEFREFYWQYLATLMADKLEK
jgi:hypothetical protein